MPSIVIIPDSTDDCSPCTARFGVSSYLWRLVVDGRPVADRPDLYHTFVAVEPDDSAIITDSQ